MSDETTGPRYPDVEVPLTRRDGNAFAILGACKKAFRRGVDPATFAEQWPVFQAEATSGDYDHLLRTVMDWFTVT